MKELSIEEKARRYEKAIKKAKSKIKNGKDHVLYEDDVIDIFPELYESENERIKNEIKDFIDYISTADDKVLIPYESWIAWLEKQGKSDETKAKEFLINKGYPIDTNGVFPTYEEMYNIIREGLEKQGEQKPSWSEEDEISFLNTLWCCKKVASIAKDENEMGTVWYAERWLKSLKDRCTWKPTEKQINAIRLARSFVTDDFSDNPTLSERLLELEKQLEKRMED